MDGRQVNETVKLLRTLSDTQRRQTDLIEWMMLSQMARPGAAEPLTRRINLLEQRLWPKGRT